jgi:hypothetical protein
MRSRRIVTGLSAITWDRTRSPVSSPGSIVMRKSASTNSEVVSNALGVQLCNLRRNPVAHGCRARIRHDQAQFAQAPPPAPRTHHPHSFGGFGHLSSAIA